MRPERDEGARSSDAPAFADTTTITTALGHHHATEGRDDG